MVISVWITSIYQENLVLVQPEHNYKIAVGTGEELQMVRIFFIQIFWLEILDTFQDVQFISEISWLVSAKLSYHLQSD